MLEREIAQAQTSKPTKAKFLLVGGFFLVMYKEVKKKRTTIEETA